MSKGVNECFVMGGLTKDPEIKNSQGGMAILRFDLAVGGSKKGANGWEDTVEYVPCTAFGKTAETMERYCVKGSQILVIGAIKTSKYKNKDGNNVYDTRLIANDIRLCGGKRREEGSWPESTAHEQAKADGYMPEPEYGFTFDKNTNAQDVGEANILDLPF